MSLNLNKFIFAGRITADPEMKQTASGITCCSFSVAVNRPYSKQQQQQEADFIRVIAWRKEADFVGTYFRKGMAIYGEGRLMNRSWTDQQGTKHFLTEIVADHLDFVESRATAEANGNPFVQATNRMQPGGDCVPYGAQAPQGANNARPQQLPTRGQYVPQNAPAPQNQAMQQQGAPTYYNAPQAPKFEEISTDEDLPF